MRIRTDTIEDLKEYAEMWVVNEIPHIYLEGTPGSGKSYTFREVTEDVTRNAWIGNCSPFAFYKKLYKVREADIIVLDDIDGLLYDRNGLRLLKEAMGSEDERTLHWNSNRTGSGKEVPAQFDIKARFCVITNDFGSRNQHTQAVQSRAVVIEHAPKPKEALDYAQNNNMITKKMREQIDTVFPPPQYLNLRDLELYNRLRKAGKDWFSVFKENVKQ